MCLPWQCIPAGSRDPGKKVNRVALLITHMDYYKVTLLLSNHTSPLLPTLSIELTFFKKPQDDLFLWVIYVKLKCVWFPLVNLSFVLTASFMNPGWQEKKPELLYFQRTVLKEERSGFPGKEPDKASLVPDDQGEGQQSLCQPKGPLIENTVRKHSYPSDLPTRNTETSLTQRNSRQSGLREMLRNIYQDHSNRKFGKIVRTKYTEKRHDY